MCSVFSPNSFFYPLGGQLREKRKAEVCGSEASDQVSRGRKCAFLPKNNAKAREKL
jgi:hypothetical protein